MTKYNYLGYGITNNEGIAKLDHDKNGDPITDSYTGTGAGEIDIVASLDDTIDESSLLSNELNLYDYIVYDDGVHSEYDKWIASGNPTIVRGSEYTQITTDGLTTANVGHPNVLKGNFELSIDINAVDTIRFGFNGGSGKATRLQINNNNDRWQTWVIRRIDGVFSTKTKSDGVWYDITRYEQNNVGYSDCTVLFYIPVPSGNPRSVKFKNLRVKSIYPDCLAYDKGTTANHNDVWDISNCNLTRGTEYSEISETVEYGFIRTKQANAIPKDCIIEFDYMNVDGAIGNNMFAIYSSENQYITIINFLYLGNLSIGAWHHIKIKIENGLMTVTNTTNSTIYTLNLTIPTEKILFLFLTPNDTTKARFKNFKAYKI